MPKKLRAFNPSAEELKIVLASINATWQAIGYEAEQLEGGVDNAGAVELCVDANRLVEFDRRNGKKADAIVERWCAESGYSAVHKRLCREIRLA